MGDKHRPPPASLVGPGSARSIDLTQEAYLPQNSSNAATSDLRIPHTWVDFLSVYGAGRQESEECVWGELGWRKLLSDGGPELSLPLQVVLIKGMEGK